MSYKYDVYKYSDYNYKDNFDNPVRNLQANQPPPQTQEPEPAPKKKKSKAGLIVGIIIGIIILIIIIIIIVILVMRNNNNVAPAIPTGLTSHTASIASTNATFNSVQNASGYIIQVVNNNSNPAAIVYHVYKFNNNAEGQISVTILPTAFQPPLTTTPDTMAVASFNNFGQSNFSAPISYLGLVQ